MTKGEILKLKIINQVLDGVLTIKEAAQALDLSTRQVMRLKKGVKEQGPQFVIHKNRGRRPVHAFSEQFKKKVVKLKEQTPYSGANFTHFTELLEEYEGIQVGRPSIHRILKEAGIPSPKKHRKRRSHHRRKRKKNMGALVQIDASPYVWLIDGTLYSLHGVIDDATGTVLGLFLSPTECLEGYFVIMRQMISKYGIPAQIYSDRHTIFFSPKSDKLTEEEQLQGKQVKLTQFGKAMEELGVAMIPAKSAQGKGRIERLWETLQSRLPVEIALNNLHNVDEVNEFLINKYMPRFNKQFAVEPKCPESAFAPLDSSINPDHILCVKEERKLDQAGAFSFNGQLYQLESKYGKPKVPPRAKITVLTSSKIGVMARYQENVYSVSKIEKRPDKQKVKPLHPKSKANPSKPGPEHPWRYLQSTAMLYDTSDRELLEALFGSQRAWR